MDWETAFADAYTVSLRDAAGDDEPWRPLYPGPGWARETLEGGDKHVVHELRMGGGTRAAAPVDAAAGRFVRVLIQRPATRWGVSLWRVDVWGEEL